MREHARWLASRWGWADAYDHLVDAGPEEVVRGHGSGLRFSQFLLQALYFPGVPAPSKGLRIKWSCGSWGFCRTDYRTPNKPRLAPAYDLVSTVAWTQHDQTIALNMAGTKRFDAIGLDTFNAFFQRLGLPGQLREELLTEVRNTTRRVLDVWGNHYEGSSVPAGLMQRVEAHMRGCPLRLAAA